MTLQNIIKAKTKAVIFLCDSLAIEVYKFLRKLFTECLYFIYKVTFLFPKVCSIHRR